MAVESPLNARGNNNGGRQDPVQNLTSLCRLAGAFALQVFLGLFFISPALTQDVEEDITDELASEKPADPTRTPPRPALIQPRADRSMLLSGTQLKSGRRLLVGERGHILVNSPGQKDWIQVNVPVRIMLCGVAAMGDQVWAVGHDAVILHSPDAGANWNIQHRNTDMDPLMDLWFENEKQGLVIGAYGVVFRTEDGGNSWKEDIIDWKDRPDDIFNDIHLFDITEAPDGTLYIACEKEASEKEPDSAKSFVLRSKDKGVSWELFMTGNIGSLFGIAVAKNGDVYTCGLRGKLFHSANQGATWKRIATGTTVPFNDILVQSDGSLLVMGQGGNLLFGSAASGFERKILPTRKAVAGGFETASGAIDLYGEEGVFRLDKSMLLEPK